MPIMPSDLDDNYEYENREPSRSRGPQPRSAPRERRQDRPPRSLTPDPGSMASNSGVNINDYQLRLRKDLTAPGACRCHGGVVFDSTDRSGLPVRCFAVPCQEDDPDAVRAARLYNRLSGFSTEVGIYSYRRSEILASKGGPLGVYQFRVNPADRSLRQLLEEGIPTEKFRDLFAKLFRFLESYADVLKQYGLPYTPLCCLSLDTVHLTPRGAVRLLPLQAFGREYPAHFLSEAGTDQADFSTDLHDAAMVALLAVSGGEDKPILPKSQCRQYGIMADCLMSPKGWRPQPEEVRDWVNNHCPDSNTRVREPETPLTGFGGDAPGSGRRPRRERPAAPSQAEQAAARNEEPDSGNLGWLWSKFPKSFRAPFAQMGTAETAESDESLYSEPAQTDYSSYGDPDARPGDPADRDQGSGGYGDPEGSYV